MGIERVIELGITRDANGAAVKQIVFLWPTMFALHAFWALFLFIPAMIMGVDIQSEKKDIEENRLGGGKCEVRFDWFRVAVIIALPFAIAVMLRISTSSYFEMIYIGLAPPCCGEKPKPAGQDDSYASDSGQGQGNWSTKPRDGPGEAGTA